MGEMLDKVKGAANEVAGKAKQALGDLTGDDAKKGEGVGQELKGKGQQIKGNIKGAINKL